MSISLITFLRSDGRHLMNFAAYSTFVLLSTHFDTTPNFPLKQKILSLSRMIALNVGVLY